MIFDEINYVLRYNFLETSEVMEELKRKPPHKHVILTGGGAPPELVELADLVTEMKCVNHPTIRASRRRRGLSIKLKT